MSEETGVDSDGVEHPIWHQEADDTCGPACIYMLERDRLQASTVGGEERIKLYTSLLPNGYVEKKGTQSYLALKKVLDRIGMPSEALCVPSMSKFIASAFFPFIARVGWAGGGGHFVVAMKVTNDRKLVCLDPWYGLVQQPLANLPSYSAARGARLSGHVVFPNASRA